MSHHYDHYEEEQAKLYFERMLKQDNCKHKWKAISYDEVGTPTELQCTECHKISQLKVQI